MTQRITAKAKIALAACLMMAALPLQAKEYHVSKQGCNTADGSAAHPLLTINAAAQLALPGDTVTVHGGTYREWVNPLNGGDGPHKRILYRAAEGERVYLKGSEVVKGWKRVPKTKGTWMATVPNSLFGDYNPYSEKMFGDWYWPNGHTYHTGDVYLNDVSLYEVEKKEQVLTPDTIRTVRDPQGTQLVWYAEVDAEKTTLYAHFGNVDPNKEMVEISVRPTCFYPTRQGLDYITFRGFHVSQAATRWAAPTAEQVGMVSTHWCKGWIIEHNVIRNSRSCGITLGKERATGHNLECNDKRLDGTAHYIEVVFRTLRNGWDRDHVGSHIVRYNEISDCEQTGICGSMGAAFSEIYGNHIHHIWAKRLWNGAEMAGIKLHGAIDTYIHNNRIHHCGYAIWLDWMNQGSRVSSNLVYNNTQEDFFFEVDHGPYMVDNNLMLSPQSIREYSDGGAFVHNIICGYISHGNDQRYTPYHLNHHTAAKGICTITNGDHRFYNNIFVGGKDPKQNYGLASYDKAGRPIHAAGNMYCSTAKPAAKGKDEADNSSYEPELKIEERADGVYISWMGDLSPLTAPATRAITPEILGHAQLTGYPYEMTDGTPICIDKDYFGHPRSTTSPLVGPIELSNPNNKTNIKVWDNNITPQP
ncbi:MAG: right-handed parallel beta-helix repeat-containing protein [Prevotella sp.]